MKYLLFAILSVVAVSQETAKSVVEKEKLRIEFKRAWGDARMAMEHEAATDLRQLALGQKQKQKAWRADEKTKRKEYFEKHTSGPERRAYVQDYIKRKAAFEKQQEHEKIELRNDWKEKRKKFQEKRKKAEADFEQALKDGKIPPKDLWPNK